MSNTERNLADSLAEHLHRPEQIARIEAAGGGGQSLIAIPGTFKLEKVDDESLLATPRRAKTTAGLVDPESFLAYVQQHRTEATKVWCDFDPQTYKLSFTAVIDDHHGVTPGWRQHRAVYKPEPSAEWKVWTALNEQSMSQVEFATFLERHSDDINTGPENTFPSSLDMLTMATNFEANGEKRCKSVVRLQGGGLRVDFVDDDDEATLTQMRAFDRFMIGLPVFWAGPGYRIEARLKYRAGAKVSFWYELIRPDRAHEAAAKDLIDRIRAELSAGTSPVPMLMGDCK